MNEVIPNLWLGDLRTALKVDLLRSRNIHSVLSVMRGKVTVSEVRSTVYLLTFDNNHNSQ